MSGKRFLLVIWLSVIAAHCKPKVQSAGLVYTAFLYNGAIYYTANPRSMNKTIVDSAEKIALYSLNHKTSVLTKIKELK